MAEVFSPDSQSESRNRTYHTRVVAGAPHRTAPHRIADAGVAVQVSQRCYGSVSAINWPGTFFAPTAMTMYCLPSSSYVMGTPD